jgi:hypothetical protein
MEIYKEYLDFLMNFINDIIDLLNDHKIDNNEKFMKLSLLILNEKNRIFIGFTFILISFILYLIDTTN